MERKTFGTSYIECLQTLIVRLLDLADFQMDPTAQIKTYNKIYEWKRKEVTRMISHSGRGRDKKKPRKDLGNKLECLRKERNRC